MPKRTWVQVFFVVEQRNKVCIQSMGKYRHNGWYINHLICDQSKRHFNQVLYDKRLDFRKLFVRLRV